MMKNTIHSIANFPFDMQLRALTSGLRERDAYTYVRDIAYVEIMWYTYVKRIEISPIFCEVSNVCVAKGTIPKLWKLSAISPAAKKQIQLAITTIGQQLSHL